MKRQVKVSPKLLEELDALQVYGGTGVLSKGDVANDDWQNLDAAKNEYCGLLQFFCSKQCIW